jgi:tetratricopeptide (TPR) repeat protein
VLRDEADTAAVEEICRRLDGIALAIELAAARMVSMSPTDVRDRLGDRFRLLAGSRRGLERHQTLRHAVGWSYDLLGDDERTVLCRCSVFAGGFDLAAALAVCGAEFDEYGLLDVLDSLVRKSLIVAGERAGTTRFGLLETIRQFADDQLAATGTSGEVRDRHARWYADQAIVHWDRWDGPGYRVAVEWVDVEFDNLRAGFRWAADQGDLDTATAIAAHTAMLTFGLQRFEPVGWAEEILPAATTGDVVQLPRLCTAAANCAFIGRPDDAVGYAQTAQALEADPRYDSFEPGWARTWEATADRYAGRIDRCLEIYTDLAAQATELAHLLGLCWMLYTLPAIGRPDEAIALAEDTVTAARAHANPYWIAFALSGYGRTYTQTEPTRALDTLRQGLGYAREHRIPLIEALLARALAELEAINGDFGEAFRLFESAVDAFQRAGDIRNLAVTLATLAVAFDRLDRPEVATTIYGAATNSGLTAWVVTLPGAVDHLRTVLGDTAFDQYVTVGADMNLDDIVTYARAQTQLARTELETDS